MVEKNNSEVLEFKSCGECGETLSFSWIMELNQGETVRLRVGEYGAFGSDTNFNCIFNGKFIRN